MTALEYDRDGQESPDLEQDVIRHEENMRMIVNAPDVPASGCCGCTRRPQLWQQSPPLMSNVHC